eukprot:TRINITY_DN10219_c0_g1_i1.p1 TRINITY_DN10219_c0_g1~~TRINITY_DN10219_c0_g1_i1.p1  ORF type:complete len:769 (+),score=228.91 TRINITY_DN10219_c0_g1_i1:86-2392(+)
MCIRDRYDVKYPEEDEGARAIVREKDGSWKTTVFPSLLPSSREEVSLLEATVTKMVDNVQEEAGTSPMNRCKHTLQALFACTHELGRHVVLQSGHRGRLMFQLLESIEEQVSDVFQKAELAATQAAESAVAARNSEHTDEVSRLKDKYDSAEMNVHHLLSQLEKWEEMQRVFREELDSKHEEHIAFRREQELMRRGRKELDMDVQVLKKEAEILHQEAQQARAAKGQLADQLREAQQQIQLVTTDFEKRLAGAYESSDEWNRKADMLQLELDMWVAETRPAEHEHEQPPAQPSKPEPSPSEEEQLEGPEDTQVRRSVPGGGSGGRLAGLLAPVKKKPKKKKKGDNADKQSREGLEQLIDELYDRKILADIMDDECRHEHARMAEFVYEYLLQTHASKAAADEEGRILLVAVKQYRQNSEIVSLFADFLDEKHDLNTLNFYLSLKAQMKTSPYGVSYPSRSGVRYIDFFKTLMVSRTVLAPILDMKAIMAFNSKVEKLSVKATEADVHQTLSREPNGQERKLACQVYENLCLQMFEKQQKARIAAVKKALFGKKLLVEYEDFVQRLTELDPSMHARHAQRIFAQAAALSTSKGVSYSAFMEVADKCGLLNQQFSVKAAESARREDPVCANIARSAIKKLWKAASHVPAWVADKLHNSQEWNHISDAAQLESLCRGFEGSVSTSENPAYKLAQGLQKVVLFSALAVSQHTAYPSALEEIPLFEEDVRCIVQLTKRWARIPEVELRKNLNRTSQTSADDIHLRRSRTDHDD